MGAGVNSVLIALGFTQSINDYLLFVRHTDSHFIALLVYVDDILVIGDDIVAIEQVKSTLHGKFTIKDLGRARYFLGMKILELMKGFI